MTYGIFFLFDTKLLLLIKVLKPFELHIKKSICKNKRLTISMFGHILAMLIVII